MISLIWRYIPSSKGIPRYTEIDPNESYKKGWIKTDNTGFDCEKEIVLIRELKWSELSESQRTGIYNHTFPHTCNIKGDNQIGPGKNDQNRYIFQERIGKFIIKYNGGSFDLYINTGSSDQHIIRNMPQKSPVKMVLWLKRYAQYLIDEPDQLQKIIANPVLIDRQEKFTAGSTDEIKEKPAYKVPGWIPYLNLSIVECLRA